MISCMLQTIKVEYNRSYFHLPSANFLAPFVDSNKTQDTSVKADPVNSNTTWIACQAPQGYAYYYNQITGGMAAF